MAEAILTCRDLAVGYEIDEALALVDADFLRILRRAAENIRANLAEIPDDRLLIETDSPYLAPVPFRGNENTPGLLPLVALEAARVRGKPLAEIAELSWRNATAFFRIDVGGEA